MQTTHAIPELLEWAEYYCPWCYIAAVRLHCVQPEYEGRVMLRHRFFPLELLRGEAPPRDILEQEWWLAALQEADAPFAPYPLADWPTTTLPAFDAAWAASQQGSAIGTDYDLRVRRAFFAQGRNIGRPDVLHDIAREAVLEDSRIARERYHVRGTPTLMLADGTRLRWPIAFPTIRERKIVADGAAAVLRRKLSAVGPRALRPRAGGGDAGRGGLLRRNVTSRPVRWWRWHDYDS